MREVPLVWMQKETQQLKIFFANTYTISDVTCMEDTNNPF
jgi:hypothetical protein